MSQTVFGTGLATLTPTIAGVVTPVQVAALQDITLDLSLEEVLLYGNLQFPIDGAKGKGKLSGKIKTGYFAGGLIQYILSGGTSAVGNTVPAFNESHTIPTTPYQVTATQNTTWVSDLAVFDVTANKFLTRVSAGPTTGQYSVASGTYTFAAADTGHVVLLCYDYTQAAIGTTITYVNQQMGTNTTFGLKLYNMYQAASSQANSANGMGMQLPAVMLSKTSLPFKNTGYLEYDVDFTALANAAGNVFYLYTGN